MIGRALFLLAATLCGATAATTIKTVYIVPSSHYDHGFVVPPEQIAGMAARQIDEVIDEAQKDPNFRWTIESVWQVLAWLRETRGLGDILPGRPNRIDALMKLIRSGRIDLSMAWGSMHGSFMGEEELNRLCYDFARLRREYGIDSKIAMMDDVPGQPFSMASVLAGSGARYLLVGANQFIGGGTSLSPGDVPFYWQGPDGKRVLTWVSQSPRGGYTEGLTDFFLDPYTVDPYTRTTAWKIFNPKAPPKSDLEIMQAGMDILLKRYSDAGYRYDAVLVMHVHDFLHPSTVENLERAVRLWNGAHRSPELRIATASEFFRYIEEKYGTVIPTYRGEWSGEWSEAKTSSPEISALARKAHDEVPAAETLWNALTLTQQIPFPAGDLHALYHLLFQYDEHSGAGNTGWPGLNTAKMLNEQNRQYVDFMKRAADRANYLMRAGISLFAEDTGPPRPSAAVKTWPLLVWNGLSWRRTDAASAPSPEKGSHIVAIRDARTGESVPFDIDSAGNAIFIARDLPSIGYALFEVDTAPGEATTTLAPRPGSLNAENNRFRVRLRRDGDIESIFDLQANHELINQHSTTPFNHLLRSEGDEPAPVPTPFQPQIHIERGRILTDLVVTRAGSGFPSTRIRLYDALPRVEIHDDINLDALPFASARFGSDSYFFCFPFALDPAMLTVRPEEQYGFAALPADYLPGARRDAMTSQHVVALSDAHATMLLAHRQAFHFVFAGYVRTVRIAAKPVFPAMFTGKWPLPEATLYSKAFRRSNQGDMRLFGITTFPTVEPGLGNTRDFDYAVSSSSAPFDPVAAARFGQNFDIPPRAVYVPYAPPPSRSFFAVDQPNVRIVTVKQAEASPASAITPTNLEESAASGEFVMRLQEIAGRNTPRVAIALPGRVTSCEIVNLTEEKVLAKLPSATPLIVSLGPYQTLTVRFKLATRE